MIVASLKVSDSHLLSFVVDRWLQLRQSSNYRSFSAYSLSFRDDIVTMSYTHGT
jgi:hypothetical protein